MPEVTYEIAGWPQEERVVAELIVDDEYIGWVRDRGGKFQLLLHSHPTELTIPLDSLLDVLTEAKGRLGS